MKTFLKILKWIGILLLIAVLGIFISGYVLYNKKYTAPYPDIRASTDSAVIAHGKHLVYYSAHCVDCHFKPGDSLGAVNGEEVGLAGGAFPFVFPGGKFYSANISSDPEFGIGNIPDSALARAFRYGVKPDGSVLAPFMEMQNLSDEDLTAIISFLRTLPPVKYKVPHNELNLLGKAIMAFFIRPEGPKGTPPKEMKPDTTVAYGEYLVTVVSNCKGCHTYRNPNTGAYEGELLAGGPFEPVHGDPTKMIVTPNLTPDPETGHIYHWDYNQFRTRFTQGVLVKETVMPWGSFKHLDSIEVKAIWKYLQTVPPVHKVCSPPVQDIKDWDKVAKGES